MVNSDDSALIQSFASSGDAEAFAEIVRRHASLVFATCRRILKDSDHAEDAAQQTFFDLFKNPHSVRGSLAGWLHSVGIRRSIDMIRRESRRAERESDYAQIVQAADSEWKEILDHVDEALEQVQEKDRVLLIEHFLEGRTQADLAESLGVSQATISRNLQTGVASLREKLRERGFIIPVSALLLLFEAESATSAPVSLLHQLGKMSLAEPPSSNSVPSSLSFGKVAIRVSILVGAILFILGGFAYLRISSIRGPAVILPSPRQQRIIKRVRPGDQFQFVGLQVTLVGVFRNNPSDPKDDQAEYLLTMGGVSTRIRFTRNETIFFGNFELTVESIQFNSDGVTGTARIVIWYPANGPAGAGKPIS